jgi:hypothetical protein
MILTRLPPWAPLAVCAALLEAALVWLRRLHPFDQNVVAVIGVALAASVVYLVAVWLAFSRADFSGVVLLVVVLAALAFRLTLLPLPATLSADLDRYQWDGRIQQAGYNPYLIAPNDPALAAYRPAPGVRLPGPEFPTAYPPLTELAFRAAATLDGPLAFKLLSVVFDFGTLLVLVALLRARGEPAVRALAYGWCPLVVVEFAGSGHNDSLALFAFVAACYWIIRARPALSIAALAAGAALKWFPAVALPVFARRGKWWAAPLFLGVLALTFVPYAGAGVSLFAGLASFAQKWRNNASLFELLRVATGSDAVTGGVAAAVVAVLAVYGAWKKAEPLRASFILVAALLLFSANVFPWYVTWLVPFLCFFPEPAFLLWTATVFLSYHVLVDYTALGLWHYDPGLLWLEYLPVYGLLIFRAVIPRPKAEGSASLKADSSLRLE